MNFMNFEHVIEYDMFIFGGEGRDSKICKTLTFNDLQDVGRMVDWPCN